MPTNIEWTNETWNPVTGCSKISEGCRHCYAERMAKRLAGRYGYPERPHHFDVTFHEDKLDQPLKWKKPRMIFVCSMGDLFHDDVPDNYIAAIWHRMIAANHHTFQVLTKRPERMSQLVPKLFNNHFTGECYIPDNIWLGVTAENQEAADERIPWLLKTPAVVHFVSVEPMLGPLLFRWANWLPVNDHSHLDGLRLLDWIICGGETGPGARRMKWEWVEDLYAECKDAHVPFFFKKVGDNPDPNLVGAPITEYRQWLNSPIANNQCLESEKP